MRRPRIHPSVAVGLVLGFTMLLPVACEDQPAGPSGSVVRVVLQPEFDAANAQLDGALDEALRVVDEVRVRFEPVASEGSTVDTTVAWPLDQQSLTITVTLTVVGEEQTFDYGLELRKDEQVLVQSEGSATLTASDDVVDLSNEVTAGAEIAVPGAGADSLTITRAPELLRAGAVDSLDVAVWSDDAHVSGDTITVLWRSLDTLAVHADSSSGRVTAGAVAEDTAAVVARVPYTGLADTVLLPVWAAGVAVSPSDDVEPLLTALGDTLRLVGEALDIDGGPLPDPALRWSLGASAAVRLTDTTSASSAVISDTVGVAHVIAAVADRADTLEVEVRQAIASVAIVPPADTMRILDTLRLEADAADANGAPIPDVEFAWSSLDTAIVEVDTTGLVHALAAGDAGVVASAAEAADTAGLRVQAPDLTPLALDITPPSPDTLVLGDSLDVALAVANTGDSPADSADVLLRMAEATSGEAIADTLVARPTLAVGDTFADTSTYVTPLVPDTVDEIRIRLVVDVTDEVPEADDQNNTLGDGPYFVHRPPVTVEIAIDTARLTAFEDTAHLQATAYDAAGETVADAAIEWSSTDTTVATIDTAGVVTARDNGEMRAIAAVNDAADTAAITIDQEAAAVSVAPSADTIMVGDTVWFDATARDANEFAIDDAVFTWSTGDAVVLGLVDPDSGGYEALVPGLAHSLATVDEVTGSAEVVIEADPTVQLVSAGGWFSCAIDAARAGWCWGRNSSGQLGDGSQVERRGSNHLELEATAMAGELALDAVDAGQEHACGIDTDSIAYCWGRNNYGQLGKGDTENTSTPAAVQTTERFSMVAAGLWHSCGLNSAGEVHCWGDNRYGQLGDGSNTLQTTPVQVALSDPFVSVVAGNDHTCGIVENGEAYCWGRNDSGQLGDGSSTDRMSPTRVSGTHTWKRLAAGHRNTCGVTDTGKAYCWGDNGEGQLGIGTTGTGTETPTDPVSLDQVDITDAPFTDLTVGADFACGIVNTSALCWGRNTDGQLGNGSTGREPEPTLVSTERYRAINAGWSYVCAVTTGDEPYCWGSNIWGELGNGEAARSPLPVAIADESGYVDLAAGNSHACAVRSDHAAFCWGENNDGELGDGSTGRSASPVAVVDTLPGAFERIGAGARHSCGLNTDSLAYCWGDNLYGQLGDSSATASSTAPTAVVGGYAFGSIEVGGRHTCALDPDGQAWCWGRNADGQLGDSTTTNAEAPTAVVGRHVFGSIGAGREHSCGLDGDGQALCWGSNSHGQLGDGTTTNDSVPRTVSGGHAFTSADAGGWHTCAIDNEGQGWCWGRNGDGQLGDNNRGTDSPEPVAVSASFTSLAALSTGMSHTCAVDDDGQAYCWGDNTEGQLGNGTATSYEPVPVPVEQGDLIFDSIAAGWHHTCARADNGRVYCWGFHFGGQLGTGWPAPPRYPSPQPVATALIIADGS